MTNTIRIFDIEGAWAEVIDTDTYMDMEEGKVTFIVTARVHYQSQLSRKKAFKILRNNGWDKSSSYSDDFYLRKVVKDELKIEV